MLNPDFRDILSEFCGQNVEFLLVGAYALAAHGLPRATGDIDLWIKCSECNAQRVMAALTALGVPLFDITADDFKTPGLVVQIGVTLPRIDVLTAIDGVEFDEAWSERTLIEVDGIRVPVISREHLLRNKQATGRAKDIADARWLEGS